MDKKKPVGLDPNGYPIYRENTTIPENIAMPITEAAKLHQHKTWTITDHGDKTYTITENKPEPEPKQELDGDKLLAEAPSLIEYNKREKEKQQPNVTPVTKPKQRVNEVKRFVRILNNEI